MDKQKKIEEMYDDISERLIGVLDCEKMSLAIYLHDAGYRKIPENAVVLTDDELNEVLYTCKVSMIVTDDDGEKYISLDDHNEYTERLGKIVRQRKARIEYLEKLLDDRCDRCIERERKETAEKFAERVHNLFNRDIKDSVVYTQEEKNILKEFVESIDEICKEIIGEKV